MYVCATICRHGKQQINIQQINIQNAFDSRQNNQMDYVINFESSFWIDKILPKSIKNCRFLPNLPYV